MSADTPSTFASPWLARQNYQSAERKALKDATVLDAQSAWIATTGDMPTARRIAAAVNACDGITTEALNAYAERGGISAVWAAQLDKVRAKAEAAETKLADVLDRLIEAADHIQDQGDEKDPDELHFIGELRAAIERAKVAP